MFYFQNTWKHESFVTFNFTFHLKAFRKEIPSRGKIWRETDIEIKYETRFNQIFYAILKSELLKIYLLILLTTEIAKTYSETF